METEKRDDAVKFHAMVCDTFEEVADMLLSKNAQYGNAALSPLRVFSQSFATEQIRVRMDDKLSRIFRGNGEGDEDAIKDLLGYMLMLGLAEKGWQQMPLANYLTHLRVTIRRYVASRCGSFTSALVQSLKDERAPYSTLWCNLAAYRKGFFDASWLDKENFAAILDAGGLQV